MNDFLVQIGLVLGIIILLLLGLIMFLEMRRLFKKIAKGLLELVKKK